MSLDRDEFQEPVDWTAVLNDIKVEIAEQELPLEAPDSGKNSPTPPAKPKTKRATTPNTAKDKARRHVCSHPGCEKSFTTSGHLLRHIRIHTGEKQYQCTFQGCESRFSRHDNMLQHYRSHICRNSRRKKGAGTESASASARRNKGSPRSAAKQQLVLGMSGPGPASVARSYEYRTAGSIEPYGFTDSTGSSASPTSPTSSASSVLMSPFLPTSGGLDVALGFPFPDAISPPPPSPGVLDRPLSANGGSSTDYFYQAQHDRPPILTQRHSYSSLPTYPLAATSPIEELSNQLDFADLLTPQADDVPDPSSLGLRQMTPRATNHPPSFFQQYPHFSLPPVPSTSSSVAPPPPFYPPGAFSQQPIAPHPMHQPMAAGAVFSFSPPASPIAPHVWSRHNGSPRMVLPEYPAQHQHQQGQHAQHSSSPTLVSYNDLRGQSPHVLLHEQHQHTLQIQQQQQQEQRMSLFLHQQQQQFLLEHGQHQMQGSQHSSPVLNVANLPLLPDGRIPSVLQSPRNLPVSDDEAMPPSPTMFNGYSYYAGPGQL